MTRKTKQDGGQAFPRAGAQTNAGWSRPTDGMTLRDWFAGQALTAVTMKCEIRPKDLARISYEIADAMLEARKQ